MNMSINDGVSSGRPAGASRPRKVRDLIAGLCIALTCGACEKGPVVKCGGDPGPVGLSSKRWVSSDLSALENVMQLGAVVEASGVHGKTVEQASSVVLFGAIKFNAAPTVDELVATCERSVGGLTARELLKNAVDVCEDGEDGVLGLPFLYCDIPLFRSALKDLE